MWIKNNHTIAYLVLAVLARISKYAVIMLPSGTILTNIIACSGKTSRMLWLWIDCLGVLLKLIISVYIPRLFGYTIVADRYLPDTIVAISLTLRSLRIFRMLPVRLLLYIMLNKTETIMIMLDCNY